MSVEATSTVDPLAREASEIVIAALHPHAVSVFLFGSRARGDARSRSDIDLAVLAPGGLPPEALATAREALEESTIAQRVDLVDLAAADPDFRRRIMREGILCNG